MIGRKIGTFDKCLVKTAVSFGILVGVHVDCTEKLEVVDFVDGVGFRLLEADDFLKIGDGLIVEAESVEESAGLAQYVAPEDGRGG